MAKFQRNYHLSLQTNDNNTKRSFDQFINIQPPFTVEFDITRNPMSTQVMGTLRIFNLAKETRERIHKVQYNTDIFNKAVFKAGYGTDLQEILVGNISRCYSRREGVNYITTVEIYSGQYQYLNSEFHGSVAKGITKRALVDQLIAVLPQLNKPIIGRSIVGAYEARGPSLTGKTIELIKQQLSVGQFYIDNETPYVVSEGEVLSGIINTIDSSSGLMGSPQYEEYKITFTMLFEPRILMFQELQLTSATEGQFSGTYKVMSIRHYGTISDSICGQAMTDIEAIVPQAKREQLAGR